jgi:hypothetical protein
MAIVRPEGLSVKDSNETIVNPTHDFLWSVEVFKYVSCPHYLGLSFQDLYNSKLE